MSLDPAIFRALVAQGATPEMLLAVVEADAAVREEKLAKKRADTAARVRKHRGKPVRNDGNACNALQSVTADTPPNDIYSNPPKPSEANASEPPFAEKVVSAWNHGPAKRGARKANKLDASRLKALTLRRREHGDDAVFAAIRGIAISDWHCGIGSNGWRADIGWMLKSPENFLKAMERADEPGAMTAPAMTAADRAAYLRKLDERPFLRGVNTPGAPPGPRSFGQLAAGIAGNPSLFATAGTA